MSINMEQANIIEKVTELFVIKLQSLSNTKQKIKVITEADDKKPGDNIIKLTLLGLEDCEIQNLYEKIQQKGNDDNGNEIEYMVEQPSLIYLKYMVTPYSKSNTEVMKIIGYVIRLIRDDGILDINDYNWVNNKSNNVKIEKMPDMNLYKQMELFNLLKMDYSPSLFFQIKVGINSNNKEIFKRVEKRKFTAYDKTVVEKK